MFHVLTCSCPKDKIRLSDRVNFFPFKIALVVQTCPVAFSSRLQTIKNFVLFLSVIRSHVINTCNGMQMGAAMAQSV